MNYIINKILDYTAYIILIPAILVIIGLLSPIVVALSPIWLPLWAVNRLGLNE